VVGAIHAPPATANPVLSELATRSRLPVLIALIQTGLEANSDVLCGPRRPGGSIAVLRAREARRERAMDDHRSRYLYNTVCLPREQIGGAAHRI
jgi:hypothetical protein